MWPFRHQLDVAFSVLLHRAMLCRRAAVLQRAHEHLSRLVAAVLAGQQRPLVLLVLARRLFLACGEPGTVTVDSRLLAAFAGLWVAMTTVPTIRERAEVALTQAAAHLASGVEAVEINVPPGALGASTVVC